MNLAYVDADVWVGGKDACGATEAGLHLRFDRVIHIWREDQATSGCWTVLNRAYGPRDLLVKYTENQSLSFSDTTPDLIAAFARQPGRLLVHCWGGVCRGPTVAVLALVARGVEYGRAVGDVARAVAGYGGEPFGNVALRDIARWAGSQAGRAGDGTDGGMNK